MPNICAHVSEEFAKAVEGAAFKSDERLVSPYVAEAVRRRLEKEGMMPASTRAELFAAIDEVGEEQALEVLRRASRRKGAQVRTVAA